jgi:hypothetical protein
MRSTQLQDSTHESSTGLAELQDSMQESSTDVTK